MENIKITEVSCDLDKNLRTYLLCCTEYMDLHPHFILYQAKDQSTVDRYVEHMNEMYSGGSTSLLKELLDPIMISATCNRCGDSVNFYVDRQDLLDFKSHKKLVQQAFPYLVPSLRELFLSGLCYYCWDEVVKSE